MSTESLELRDEAAQYDAMQADELYALLVPQEERERVAYAPGGLIARGRELFQAIWPDIRGGVCGHYRRYEKTIGNQVDLIALVAAPLIGNPMLAGINVVALAALVVKIGVAELCRKPT